MNCVLKQDLSTKFSFDRSAWISNALVHCTDSLIIAGSFDTCQHKIFNEIKINDSPLL